MLTTSTNAGIKHSTTELLRLTSSYVDTPTTSTYSPYIYLAIKRHAPYTLELAGMQLQWFLQWMPVL